MTLVDAGKIFDHWRRNPPLRTLVASIALAIGVPPEVIGVKEKKQFMTAKEFERLLAATGGTIEGLGQFNG